MVWVGSKPEGEAWFVTRQLSVYSVTFFFLRCTCVVNPFSFLSLFVLPRYRTDDQNKKRDEEDNDDGVDIEEYDHLKEVLPLSVGP